MVSYRNKDILQNSKLRRLAGEKKGVSSELPTAGDNVAPAPTTAPTTNALKDAAIRAPSYAGNTNRPAGDVSSLTALAKQTSNPNYSQRPRPIGGQDPALNAVPTELSRVKPAAPQSWTEQKMMGNMNVGDFVSMAGSLGHAIAPDTAEGRVGQVAAGYAIREQERVKNEPDKELKRRKTLAEIARLERPDKETSALLRNYDAAVKGGYKGTLKDWKEVGKKTSAMKSVQDFNMVDGKLMKGSFTADGGWTSNRQASPAEEKKWKTDSKDSGLTFNNQVKLEENLTQSAHTAMGNLFDEDQGMWTDSEGNPLSPAQTKKIKTQVSEDLKDTTNLMNEGFSMGGAQQLVARKRVLKRQKKIKDTYDKISGIKEPKAQLKALSQLDDDTYQNVKALMTRDADKKAKDYAELNRPRVSQQTSLQAIEKERGLEYRAKMDNPLITTGPTAKKMGESILDMADKVLPSLKGINEKIKKLPGFTDFDKRMTGQ